MRHPARGAGRARLRRSLTLPLITFYGLGTILGAGIYVLVGEVAARAGAYAPLSFVLAGLLAALTGLSYTELCARYPKSAGEALYIERGLGRRALSVLVGGGIVLAGVVSSATLANGFIGYLQVFVPVAGAPAISVLVLALGALAAWGIAESVRVAAAITVIEIGGLLLILFVAGDSFATLPGRLGEFLPPADVAAWNGILLGAFLAFYAFIGFEDMVNVAEEVRDVRRTLPRAILIAIVVSTILYLLVALVTVLSVPRAELAASHAPLALVYERATGAAPVPIAVISLFAVVNGALIQMIMATRVLYGMSRQGWLPAALGRVDRRTRTPLVATGSVTAAVLALALGFHLVTLAQATSLIVLTVFALVNLSLVRIQRRRPHPRSVRTVPRWVPVAGFLSCAGLLVYQLYAWASA